MTRADKQSGMALVEILLAMLVSGMLVAGLTSTVIYTFRVSGHSRIEICALSDIQRVADQIASDVRQAQDSDLEIEGPAASQVTLTWTSWIDENGEMRDEPVVRRCQYVFPGSEGTVQRSYWEAYQEGDPPTSTQAFGRYLSDVRFSRHQTDGGGSYIRIYISSTPEGRTGQEEAMAYQIGLRQVQEMPVV